MRQHRWFMDEQILFTVFQDPFGLRLAFDDLVVLHLAIVFGVGALGTMAALAISTFVRPRKEKGRWRRG